MTSDPLLDRDVQLANGAIVPLRQAAAYYGLLLSHAACNDAEWDLVYHLRQACLGRPLDHEQVAELRGHGLVDAAGQVDPVLRQVVLAAVRGEDRAVRLDSPFTTHLDRAVFEFGHAREVIRTQVDDRTSVERFLQQDDVDRGLRGWRRRMDAGNPPEGLSPL